MNNVITTRQCSLEITAGDDIVQVEKIVRHSQSGKSPPQNTVVVRVGDLIMCRVIATPGKFHECTYYLEDNPYNDHAK